MHSILRFSRLVLLSLSECEVLSHIFFKDFVEIFDRQSSILVEKLRPHVDKCAFNIFPITATCSLDIICGGYLRSELEMISNWLHYRECNGNISQCAKWHRLGIRQKRQRVSYSTKSANRGPNYEPLQTRRYYSSKNLRLHSAIRYFVHVYVDIPQAKPVN